MESYQEDQIGYAFCGGKLIKANKETLLTETYKQSKMQELRDTIRLEGDKNIDELNK